MSEDKSVKTMSDEQYSLSKRMRLGSLAGKHFGGDRDLYEVMGYPRHVGVEEFVDVYERQDIAGRIVDAYPDATWREPPEAKGDEAVMQAVNGMDKKFRLYKTMHRLDRLTNMGHYGVLVLGLDGGEPMWRPARGTNYNLIYLQPHSERTAQITKWEDDPASPRYGMPVMYRVTTGVNWTGAGAGQKSVNVHWTRVVHVAERALEDVSIGTPRLKRVYNRLMDLDKLLGGSAEMYWQNVAMLLAFIASADVEWDPEEADTMKEELAEMQNGLRRMIRLRGVEPQNLAPGLQGAQPGDHVDKQMDMIAGASGIPKRILLGNEAGELASTQDETNWQSRVAERREQFASPIILEPLFERLQKLGVVPRGDLEFEWPESDTLGERGRAEVADRIAGAVQKYTSSPGGDAIITPDEFREILGYDKRPEFEPDMADTIDEGDEAAVEKFGTPMSRSVVAQLNKDRA